MVPYVSKVVLHQETIFFLQMMSSLDILGINCLTSVSLEVFIQVDEVNLNRYFFFQIFNQAEGKLIKMSGVLKIMKTTTIGNERIPVPHCFSKHGSE